MASRLDDILGGGAGFLNSFELASVLAVLRLSAEDRLDTLVDFTTRRGHRFCPLALDLLLGPVFDQDSEEEFELREEDFPPPVDVSLDEDGFVEDEEFFDDEFDYDLGFQGEIVVPGVPSEPRDEFGDPISQEDFDFFDSEVFDFGEVGFDEGFGSVEGFGFMGFDDFLTGEDILLEEEI